MPIQLAQLSAFPLNGTARLCRLLLPLALCAVPVSNQAAALNDTGITFCAYVIPSASTATASASAVDTALAKRTSALDALNTAAINVNAAANTAAVSAAAVKTAADTALASVNAAKNAATAAGASTTTQTNQTTVDAQTAAASAIAAANNNVTSVSTQTTTNSVVTGATKMTPIASVSTSTITSAAQNAKFAVSTLTSMTSDITAASTIKANQANNDAAIAKNAMSDLTIAIAQNLTCTPLAPATTCTPPTTPSDVIKAQGSINTLATTAAATAAAASTAQSNSTSMAVDTSDKAVTAYTDAASIRIIASQYLDSAAVNAKNNAVVTTTNTAKTSASAAIPVAQAATAVAKASTDVNSLDTAATKSAADTNGLVTSVNLYNTAVDAYNAAVAAYEQAKIDAGTSNSIAADTALCAIVAADTIAGVDPRYATYPRQDARYGRDAESAANILPKVGSGRAGFDFSRVANNGTILPPLAVPLLDANKKPIDSATLLGTTADDWACTKDNVTGLVWEVKTTTDPRSKDFTYTWDEANNYAITVNAIPAINAIPYQPANSSANPPTPVILEVKAIPKGLCGFTDWRLPTVKELESIVDFSNDNLVARIDKTYFPNTSPENTWTSNKVANYPSYVWTIYFAEGNTNFKTTNNKYAVRLVRGGK